MNASKTPSSLKWLLNRRARLAGELDKTHAAEVSRLTAHQAELNRIEAERDRICDLNANAVSAYEGLRDALGRDLRAIDQVLQLHEIQIDPDLISPVRCHNKIAATDHGHMTRLIYECLRAHSGGPCSATQVALHVASALGSTGRTEDFSDLRYRIRRRLGYMTWEGRLERMHAAKGCVEGKWRLPVTTSQPGTLLDDGGLASTLATTARDHN